MISRIIKLAISILFFIAHKVNHAICSLVGRQMKPVLVIITYHPVRDSDAMQFEKQMKMLLHTGKPVSLIDDIAELPHGYNIAVTFDDAYQSVLNNALIVLRSNNIPATIFVPTGCLGKKPVWINDPSHIYADETVLTEKQLLALPPDLITIGSHSVNHIRLNNIDINTARKEIMESNKTLEKMLNRKITLFAAPYATFDESFTPLFKEAGYERVFLNIPTFPATNISSYILGRTCVEPTDWAIEFRLKLMGGYQWLPLAIRFKEFLIKRYQ